MNVPPQLAPASSLQCPPEEKEEKDYRLFFFLKQQRAMRQKHDSFQKNIVDMELGSYLVTRNIDSEVDPLVW